MIQDSKRHYERANPILYNSVDVANPQPGALATKTKSEQWKGHTTVEFGCDVCVCECFFVFVRVPCVTEYTLQPTQQQQQHTTTPNKNNKIQNILPPNESISYGSISVALLDDCHSTVCYSDMEEIGCQSKSLGV